MATYGKATSVARPVFGQLQNAVADPNKALQNVLARQAQPQTATPNTTYLDIAKAYEQQARNNFTSQEQALANQLAQSRQSTNAQYDTAAAGNYINYLRQQNALPEQLASQGIRGGASESALTRIANAYALNQGNNAASRAAALGQVQSSYDTNIANLRQALEDRILNNNLQLQQSQAEYNDVLAQREQAAKERAEDLARDEARYADEQKWKEKEWETARKDKVLEQYAATISRFTSTSQIDKAIANLRKNKPSNYTQRIWLLKQRRAEIVAAKGGGGGGGSRGGGGGGGSKGGGGGSNSNSNNTSSSKKNSGTFIQGIAKGAGNTVSKGVNNILKKYV